MKPGGRWHRFLVALAQPFGRRQVALYREWRAGMSTGRITAAHDIAAELDAQADAKDLAAAGAWRAAAAIARAYASAVRGPDGGAP